MHSVTRNLICGAMVMALSLLTGAAAQTRIAYADIPSVYSMMPELEQARTSIEKRSNELHGELESMRIEMERKYGEYQTINATPSASEIVKERRLQEIQELDRKIQQFVASVSSSMKAYEQSLLLPIVEKVKDAVSKVGAEGGYTLVLADLSLQPVDPFLQTGLQPVYMGADVEDVTSQVKAALGLAEAP